MKFNKIITTLSLILALLSTSYTMEPPETKSRQSWIEPDFDAEFDTELRILVLQNTSYTTQPIDTKYSQSWTEDDFANYSFAESSEDSSQPFLKFNWAPFSITPNTHLTKFGAYSDILTDYHIYLLEISDNKNCLSLKEFMIQNDFLEEETKDIVVKETTNRRSRNPQDSKKSTKIQASNTFCPDNKINNSILQEVKAIQTNKSHDNNDKNYGLDDIKKTKKKQKKEKENCIIS